MRRNLVLVMVSAVILLTSCVQSAMVPYVQDATRDSVVTVAAAQLKTIQVNDVLSIYVESNGDPASTIPFNQETNRIALSTTGSPINQQSGSHLSGYPVDLAGDIQFPVLGKIHVAGMTHPELAKYIEKRLVDEGHIKEPTVVINLQNFKVTLLGEVKRPGQFVTDGQRLSIFDAIALAGDLTDFGRRDSITVIREENGTRVVGYLDVSSKTVFDSPYYYLHQNDIVYVEPSEFRKKQTVQDTYAIRWMQSGLSVLSILTSLLMTVVTLTRGK